jgi:NAC domain
MNAEKLARLAEQVRTGGPGSVRRKRKAVHKNATVDEKKVKATLKRLGVNDIPGIEEVNLFKEDGTVIHFVNPKGEKIDCFYGLMTLTSCLQSKLPLPQTLVEHTLLVEQQRQRVCYSPLSHTSIRTDDHAFPHLSLTSPHPTIFHLYLHPTTPHTTPTPLVTIAYTHAAHTFSHHPISESPTFPAHTLTASP